jgi:hypothetical protein
MSNSYSVDVAIYDGSSVSNDPLVWTHGFFNGTSAGYVPVYWSAIQRANVTGGVAAVQKLLGPFLMGAVTGQPFTPAPHIDGTISIPAPVTRGSASVTCAQALVAPWTA